MTNMTRFDPFADLVRFEPFRDFEPLFRYPRAAWRGAPESPEIRMDVCEDAKAYRVKAEIPGVKKEDIKVAIEGNQVSIGAEVKREKEVKQGETVVRSERYYGTQYRAFTLDTEIDAGKAEAKLDNGVLELVLPKKEGAAPRHLAIQ